MPARFLTSRAAAASLGVHPNTLRNWDAANTIETIRTAAGQRLYNVDSYLNVRGDGSGASVNICYCRVSSRRQQPDLQRQIEYLQSAYPDHRIISDIGSGINFKRKGLQTLLDLAMRGALKQLVVAHKDRLCRFGFDIIDYIVRKGGGEIVVLNNDSVSPSRELVDDLLSIVHVFSCRIYGLRKYKRTIRRDAELEDQTEETEALPSRGL
jgi:predicted site-specific integrase-resolvase